MLLEEHVKCLHQLLTVTLVHTVAVTSKESFLQADT